MCFKDSTLIIIKNYLFIATFLMPIIYLFIIYIKNKEIKFFHYLITIILLIGILYIRSDITKYKCKEVDNPVNQNINNNKNNEDDNKNNPYYVKTTPKGYVIEKKDGAYYVNNYLIVNKSYPLDSEFVPKNTYQDINNQDRCHLCIDKEAYGKWLEMKSDASALNLNIYISSGYRSYSHQYNLYNKYVNKDGKDIADTYSARPGHSEHQTSLAFDLNTIDDSFAATQEGKWVLDNAYLYGFIIRYPKDKTHETGYKYESWHLRYVGMELAKDLYNNGNWITMETYFGLDSKYE